MDELIQPEAPEAIPPPDSEEHQGYLSRVEGVSEYQEALLRPIWQKGQDYWAIYHGDRPDDRLDHEKLWRAKLHDPHVWSALKTLIANVIDILNSSDPPIQGEGIGSEDQVRAPGVERLLAYTLRQNAWPKTQETLYLALLVQSFTTPSIRWGERSHVVNLPDNPQAYADWMKYKTDAEIASGTVCPRDLADYKTWRDEIRSAFPHLRLPDIPVSGKKRIVTYRGPMIEYTNMVDILFDPTIADFVDQAQVRRRALKTRDWVLARTGEGDDKPFDPYAVEYALDHAAEDQLDAYQLDIEALAGVTRGARTDPDRDDGVEILEVTRPGDPLFKHAVILNRCAVINKRPWQMPYAHGMHPYVHLVNNPLPGLSVGESEIKQVERLAHELNTHRELGLDAALLNVLPAMQRLKDAGVPESQLYIRPGLVVDVARPDAMKALTNTNVDLAANMGVIQNIQATIDRTLGTEGNLRGAMATVGRVSATGEQGRMQQALTRIKQRVLRLEEDWAPGIRQMLGLWAEFGFPEDRANISGVDPLKGVDYTEVLTALEQDFRFRGASQAINKELQTQQLIGVYRTFGADLAAPERRELAKRTMENMGLKQVELLITTAGTQALQKIEDAKMAQIMAPPAPPSAPGSVSDEATLAAMDQEALPPEVLAELEGAAAGQ